MLKSMYCPFKNVIYNNSPKINGFLEGEHSAYSVAPFSILKIIS